MFGCMVGDLPFTYLGIPMGISRPKVIDLSPLVDRVERRLSATFALLSYGDRLTLVNSVLSFLPTYYICTLSLPKYIILSIDRVRRHCLWRGSGINSSKKSLVLWDRVCQPKSKGGLGVIDLRLQNNALPIKNLHKFYNRHLILGSPWGPLTMLIRSHMLYTLKVLFGGEMFFNLLISLGVSLNAQLVMAKPACFWLISGTTR